MKKKPWAGLLAAGPISPCLARLRALPVQLGPVAAASLRVASRIANGLKAGRAARLEELAEMPLLLVTGPEAAIPELVTLARTAGLTRPGRALVAIDTQRDSADLSQLGADGAQLATLNALRGFAEPHFYAEGDTAAIRRLRRFLSENGAEMHLLEQGKKPVFTAGLGFTGTLATPLLAAAVECFQKAGMPSRNAALLAERTLLETLRQWLRSGRQSWEGVLPQRDLRAVRRQMEALGEESSTLSEYFSETAHLALELFGQDAEWLRCLDEEAADSARASQLEQRGDAPRLSRSAAAGVGRRSIEDL